MTTTDNNTSHTFAKTEKLCRTKSIDRLFSDGASFIAYPLRIVYLIEDEPDASRQMPAVLVNVSKKKFKRAVKRNRVKRLIREGYRLNKVRYLQLLQDNGKRMDIAFLYLKNELPDLQGIEKAILKAAALLAERMEGEKAQ